MAHLPIAELSPGLIIASDIHNFHGQRLLAKGTALTPKLLTVLKSWGIASVDILDVSEATAHGTGTEDVPSERLEQARSHVGSLFRHQDLTHPVIAEILRLAVERAARQGVPQ